MNNKEIRKHYHLEDGEYFLKLGNRKSQKVRVLDVDIETGNVKILNLANRKIDIVKYNQLTITPFY